MRFVGKNGEKWLTLGGVGEQDGEQWGVRVRQPSPEADRREGK